MGIRSFFCAVMLTVFSSGAFAALSVEVKAGDPAIVKMGRVTDDGKFGWTATGFRFKTDATSVQAKLELKGSRSCALQVVIDGTPVSVIIMKTDQTDYILAENLTAGEHLIEVWKRTEGFTGHVQLISLYLNENAKVLPLQASERRIMVVGDSISCGYGNEAKDLNEGNSVPNENGYMAYGPITARSLDAEVMMVCWSGKGMYRDRSDANDINETIPKIFDRALPLDKTSKWDHTKYVPQVIVINLGTNDAHRGGKKQKPELTKEMYLGAYREFITSLHKLYPEAQIIASIGPMYHKPITEWLPELAKEDPKVHVLVYYTPNEDKMSYLGGHWHPSVKMNKLMAEKLAEKIREVCGWKE